MGNIDVSVQKNVDFNKEVFKDINKFVTTNVNLNGDLAEAEADAEAFGTEDYYALAETDTFAIVDRTGGGVECTPTLSSGQLQFEGNVDPFSFGDPIEIDFSQVDPPDEGVDGEVPDVDDFNAVGHFSPMNNDPAGGDDPGADIGLPKETLFIEDLVIVDTGADPINLGEGVFEYFYTNPEPLSINFGERSIDRNGDTLIEQCETGLLTVELPANEAFEVLENQNTGAVEIALQAGDALFTFDPDCDSADCAENTETFTMQAAFDFVAESLGEIAEYDFNMLTNEIVWYTPTATDGGEVQAFAYSESTAALDLIGGTDVVI